MTSKERHIKVANQFTKLNKNLKQVHNDYLEKISLTINRAIKDYSNKNLWKSSYNDIVDLVYAALTTTYLETTTILRETYNQISDKIPNIEDFIYKDDKITLPQRIKGYWDEAKTLLNNPQVNPKQIALTTLTAYDKILTNEMINVKAGVKKVKKPIDPDGIEVVIISNGECDCCNQGGIYLADEAPSEPPYHINCLCDSWHDFYYPTDEADLEELQELGWEEEDG